MPPLDNRGQQTPGKRLGASNGVRISVVAVHPTVTIVRTPNGQTEIPTDWFPHPPKNGQEWKKVGDGPWERTITKVSRLYDVSVVTFPAYPQTDAAVRALEAIKEQAAAEQSSRGLTTQTAGVVLKQTTRLRMITAGL